MYTQSTSSHRILIGFLAIVLIPLLLSSCTHSEHQEKLTTVASKNNGQAQIVYVNADTLLAKYDYFKVLKKNFEEKGKRAQADLQAKGAAFQREVAEYERAVPTMGAEQRKATEQRLSRKQQELAAYNQNASTDLAKEEQAGNAQLYNKVADFLKTYAKEKGYKMVLSYAKGNSAVLYADEQLDITDEVVTKLNEAYKEGK